jgi:multiple sugar transport system substrate-binding protein
VDVVWTAEFAAKGWLVPLTGDYKFDTTGFLQPTVNAATYNHTLYAAPWASDGGLLYYRTDLVKNPPKTLDEMWSDCKIAQQHHMSCYAGQFAKYEGLTVNATEAINTAGGQVVDAAGKPTVDSPQAKQGLQDLVTAVQKGYIPKQESTYQEEQGRMAFEAGKFLFMRNWPYAYSLAKTDGSSKVKNTFAVAPLPGMNGQPGASSLGGHSEAISTYCDHKQTALDFLKYITSEAQQKFIAQKGSLAPVRASLYDDPALIKQLPYLPTLKTAIANAVPRPVTPFYPAVTTAIEDNAYAALWQNKPVDQALADMQKAMESASSSG